MNHGYAHCILLYLHLDSTNYEMLGSTSRSESFVGREYGNITSGIVQRVLLALSTCSGEIKEHSLKDRDCPSNALASPNPHTGHTTKTNLQVVQPSHPFQPKIAYLIWQLVKILHRPI